MMKKILCVLLVLLLCLCLCACDSTDYKKAMKLHDAGEYQQAKEIFVALGDYENSADLAIDCDYRIALQLHDAGEYQQAKEIFLVLGDYEDSADLVKSCNYHTALKLMEQKEYEQALAIFHSQSDYEDSMTHLLTCIQELGNIYMENYDFESPIRLLSEYYEYPQIQHIYITLFLTSLSDSYLAPLTDANDLWMEYLKVWMKEVEWATQNTPAGQYIDMPQVNTSHDLIVRVQEKMQEANNAIAILREAYSDANLEVCGPEVAEQIHIIFDCTDTIAGSFENLGGWAFSILLASTPSPFASSAYSQAYAVEYAIDDIAEAVTILGELYQ